MSSPLSWFRKHQKIMLCVFGVAIMFIFTITGSAGVLDRLTDGGPGRRGSSEERMPTDVVVKWSGGKLSEDEISNLRNNRQALRYFMANVKAIAQQRGGRADDIYALPNSDADESLLELAILSREADRMGVVMGDEAIVDFLNQQTGGTVSTSDFEQIIAGMQGRGIQISDSQVFSLLSNEIKAHKLRAMVRSGGYPASPLAAWDHFNRLNRRVESELLPISVDDYVGQVAEPSNAEVESLYNEFRLNYPNPSSPDPGFKQRERRAFSFVRADFEKFLDEEKPKISDAEVQEYYEKNKDDFVTVDEDGSADAASAEAATDDATEGTEADAAATGVSEESAAESTDAVAPATPDADDTGTDGAAAKVDAVEGSSEVIKVSPLDAAAEVKTVTEGVVEGAVEGINQVIEGAGNIIEQPAPSPTALPQAEVVQDAGQQVIEAATEAVQDAAIGTEQVLTDVVSEAVGQDATAVEGTVVDATTDATADAAAAIDVVTDGAETTNAAATAATEATTEKATVDTESPTADTSNTDLTQELSDVLSGGDVPAKEKQYKPLSEVDDTIRGILARPKAQERVDEVVSNVRRTVEQYFRDYTLWEIDFEGNAEAEQPAHPDLSQFADGDKVEVGEIPLSDLVEMSAHELGQSYRVEVTQDFQYRQISFASIAYRKEFPLFTATTIPSAENLATTFLFWMTDRKGEYIPELDEVRDEVVNAVKRQKAAELMVKAAEEEAAKAQQSSDTPISQSLAGSGREFLKTGEITQMTGGAMNGVPQANLRIPGVDYVGLEFLDSLFSGDTGSVGVAVNEPKTKAYVYRIEKSTPVSQLRDEYMRYAGGMVALRYVAETDSIMSMRDWYGDLRKRYAIDWVRDPDPDSRMQ